MAHSSEKVRVAADAELGVAAGLLERFNREFGDPSPPAPELAKRLAELVAAEGMLVLLAGGPDPAGIAVVRFREDLWSRKLEAYLGELYVIPARRGEGLGRALLETVLERSRERGAGIISLDTSLEDRAAISLYESAAFRNNESGPDGPAMVHYEREL